MDDDPYEGLPLEAPGIVTRFILNHPKAWFLICIFGSISLTLLLIRPWDFM